jgi:hypothetical protein
MKGTTKKENVQGVGGILTLFGTHNALILVD